MSFWKPDKAKVETKIELTPTLIVIFSMDMTQLLLGVTMGYECEWFGHQADEIVFYLGPFCITVTWEDR